MEQFKDAKHIRDLKHNTTGFTGWVKFSECHSLYKNGLDHREDGPSVIFHNEQHDPMYYLDGIRMTEKEHLLKTKIMKTTLGKLIRRENGTE